MDSHPSQTRLVRWLEARQRAAARFAFRRPVVVLLVALGLGVLALALARDLSMNADMSGMLPEDFESVQALEALEARYGVGGHAVVVVKGGEPRELERFADALAPRLARIEGVRYVDHRLPLGFFEDRALYYLDLEAIESLRARIDARARWAQRQNNPFIIGQVPTPPPSLDFSDLEARFADLGAFGRFNLGERRSAYHIDPEARALVVLVKPTREAASLQNSDALLAEIQRAVDEVGPESFAPSMRVFLTGRYQKRVDQQQQLQGDLKVASIVAGLLVLLFLLFHFRRGASVVLVFAPLLVGLVWTFGAAAVIFGSLNILTGFIGSILLGLGIDHGIHLLSRYEVAWHAESSPEAAVAVTFGQTGRAVLIAATTTTLAFVGLSTSAFRAFHEFGVLAAVGMVFIVAAYTAVFPAMLAVAVRLGWVPRRVPEQSGSGFSRLIARAPAAVLVVFGLCVVSLGVAADRHLSFDYDFAALEDGRIPSFELDKEAEVILGRSQTPLVLVLDDVEQEAAALAALRLRGEGLGSRSSVARVAGIDDLVPEGQTARRARLGVLQESLEKVPEAWLEPEQRSAFARLVKMAGAEPFDAGALPVEVRRLFGGVEGSGRFALIFPSVSLTDGAGIQALASELGDIPMGGGEVRSAAGEAMLIADVLEMVFAETPAALAATMVLVFVSLWLMVGRLGLALVCLMPAVATMVGTLGAMALAGVAFNYLNVIMLPVLFGIAVDGGVHLSLQPEGSMASLRETGRAIVGALLTTGLGFGALMLAEHPGLSSVGQVALLGVGCNLAACLLGQTALLVWMRDHGSRRAS